MPAYGVDSSGFATKPNLTKPEDDGFMRLGDIKGEFMGTSGIDSFQFDDQGNIGLLVDGSVRFLREDDQGQWVDMPDHPAQQSQLHPESTGFTMLRSSTNLPEELPADQYDNAGLDYESSDTAMEQVDCDTDINLDRKVDVNDLLIVIGEWGKERSPADVARDGTVDVMDLLAIFETWGSCE